MERSILGIKKRDRIRATKIREATKCKNIVYMAKKLKMKASDGPTKPGSVNCKVPSTMNKRIDAGERIYLQKST